MVQPCSPALPPGPSVPQLARWSLPRDAPARGTTKAKRNDRSAAMTHKGETANLPHPATGMTPPGAELLHASEPTEAGPTN
ncbi:xanthomonadin biosynthesis protein [Xanthomonas oryzae]|nr:xanthomonadin biosynthesis protein [Xanthomonas oryzae]